MTLVATVPLRAPLPTGQGDNNWLLVINLARVADLRYGDDLMFTFGPWGYLTSPQALDRWGVLIAGVFCAGSLIAFWALAQHWLTRTLGLSAGLVAASLLTILFNSFSTPSWLLVAAIAGWVLTFLVTRRTPDRWHVVALVAASTLLLMVKFSEGLTAVALTTALVLALRSRKAVLLAGAGGPLGIVGWWLLAGQRLTDLDTWLRSNIELTSGYAGAMGLEPWGRAPLALAMLVMVVAAAGVLMNHAGRLDLWGVLRWCVVVGLTWLTVKQSFVRSDTIHHAQFYIILAAVLLVGLRWLPRCQVQMTALLLTVLMVPPLAYTWPAATDGVSWEDSLLTLASSRYHSDRLAARKVGLQVGFAVPPTMIERIGDNPVVVEPVSATVGWAYDLNMTPLPTIEPYAAYTDYLDRVNRNAVVSDPATRVLRTVGSIDGRAQLWDSPRYNLAMACRYQQVETDGRWALFERIENRCGARRVLDEQPIGAGESLDLPTAEDNEILMVRYDPEERPLSDRLAAMLLAPEQLHAVLGETAIRLPPEHASGPLILSLPASVEWPPDDQGRPTGETVAFPRDGSVVFEAVTVRQASVPVP